MGWVRNFNEGTDEGYRWEPTPGEPQPEFWVRDTSIIHNEGQGAYGNEHYLYYAPDPAHRAPDGTWRYYVPRVVGDRGDGGEGGNPTPIWDSQVPPGRVIDLWTEFYNYDSAFWLTRHDFERGHFFAAFHEINGYGIEHLTRAAGQGYFARFASFHDIANWRALQARFGIDQNQGGFPGDTPADWLGFTIARAQDARASYDQAVAIGTLSILLAPVAYYVSAYVSTLTTAAAETAAAVSTAAETTGAFDLYGALGTGLEAGIGGAGYVPVDAAAYTAATGGQVFSSVDLLNMPTAEDVMRPVSLPPEARSILDTLGNALKGSLVARVVAEILPKKTPGGVTDRGARPGAQSPQPQGAGEPDPIGALLAGAVLAISLAMLRS